jgi:hypothetical protein
MSVLNDALEKYPHPEIFNTDQGSQYTSEIHTKRLKDWVLQYPWMAKAVSYVSTPYMVSVTNIKPS